MRGTASPTPSALAFGRLGIGPHLRLCLVGGANRGWVGPYLGGPLVCLGRCSLG